MIDRLSHPNIGRYGMALLGLLAIVSISAWAWQQVQRNDAAARLVQAVQRSASPGGSARAARDPDVTLSPDARLQNDAIAASVALRIIRSAGSATDWTRDIIVVGTQQSLVTFAQRLETRVPGFALTRWRITPTSEGVRLEARATPADNAAPAPSSKMAAAMPPLFASNDGGSGAAESLPMLVGVAGRLPNDAEALVRMAGTPVQTMRTGDIIDGWQLVKIGPDYGNFTRNGQTYVSTLRPIS